MQGRRIGEHLLMRVEELSGPLLDSRMFLPDMTPEMIAAERHWFEPRCHDPATGRIVLTIQSWILKTRHHTILIDSCIGNHKRRRRSVWNELNTPYLDRMRALGVEPEAIDIVLCTHLHVDHCGWNTKLENGRWVPTFPNARYVFSKTEHDFWEEQYRVNPPKDGIDTIYEDSVLPVVRAGKSVMVDAGYELDHGMVLEMAPGHTAGHVTLEVKSGDDAALFVGDVIHTPMQIRYPELSTSVDLSKEDARVSRRRVLEKIADTPTLLAPAHFPAPYVGHVRSDGGRGFAFTFAGEGA